MISNGKMAERVFNTNARGLKTALICAERLHAARSSHVSRGCGGHDDGVYAFYLKPRPRCPQLDFRLEANSYVTIVGV